MNWPSSDVLNESDSPKRGLFPAANFDHRRTRARGLCRWEAEIETFQTAPVSPLEAFTISRYGISVTKIFPRLRKVLVYRRRVLCSFKRAHSLCPIILCSEFFFSSEISRKMSHLVSDNSRGRLRSVGFSGIANTLFRNGLIVLSASRDTALFCYPHPVERLFCRASSRILEGYHLENVITLL